MRDIRRGGNFFGARMEPEKPKGFGEFDKLARKLVQVPSQELPMANPQESMDADDMGTFRRTESYAVLRRWNDNPKDFEIVEYCATVKEAERIIRGLPKSDRYQYEVGKYE